MGHQLISTNGQIQYQVNEFVIDSPDDLKSLPPRSSAGSVAICTSNGEVYMKNTSGLWVVM